MKKLPSNDRSSKVIISLDSWKIRSFLTCPESFRLTYIENLRPSYAITGDKNYTGKGSLVHSILALYYTLRAVDSTHTPLFHGNLVLNLVKKYKIIAEAGFSGEFEKLFLERFKQYLFTYMNYDFKPIVNGGVIGVEVPFALKLFEDRFKIYILEGRIDLLSNHSSLGQVFVDHKTQERISSLYEKKIQFMCYALATGYEYGFVNYFGLTKSLSDMTLRQELIFISKEERLAFKDYLISQVYKMVYESKMKNSFFKNLNSCSGPDEKRPCLFTCLCEADSEIASLIKKQHFEVVRHWTPYEASLD